MRMTHGMIGVLVGVVLSGGTAYAQQKNRHLGPTGPFGVASPTHIKI